MKKLLLISLLLLSCQGNEGPQGPPGIPATNITIVEFCPGMANYPTLFPESGICVQKKLYGVFWMNNSAWLGEIPPGDYKSTSTSLACNFKVLNGCEIGY